MADIYEIYQRFLQQKCSREEAVLLINYFNDKANAQEIQKCIQGQLDKASDDDISDTDVAAAHRNWLKLEAQIGQPVQVKAIRRYWSLAAACVLLLIAGFAHYFMQLERDYPVDAINRNEFDFVPGGNKATLYLADGQSIELSGQHAGIISGDAITYSDGTLLTGAVVSELKLTTPRGGEYQVTLSDGTKVWLNAASSLTYPSHFTDSRRTVTLHGEAYFEVAKNANKPFIVRTSEQSIVVLGTKFNVQAYEEAALVRTTLVEGSVQVTVKSQELILRPGQQAEVQGQNLQLKNVDVRDYIAWKDGRFSFDNKPFSEVMSEIGRWYDLKIIYKSAVPKVELIGDAYRDDRLDLVLGMLELSEVKFKLNKVNRELIIY